MAKGARSRIFDGDYVSPGTKVKRCPVCNEDFTGPGELCSSECDQILAEIVAREEYIRTHPEECENGTCDCPMH